MGFRSWLTAKSYDLAIHGTEQRCLNHWRRELLVEAGGDLLEIGAGTGLNLAHYPADLPRLILSEPDLHMWHELKKKQRSSIHRQAELTNWDAEQLALPDQSIDTIVSTLVLCSVNNQQRALEELFRVLRPGGRLLFMEHVISRHPGVIRWQKLCEPFWACCSGNCRLTRDTATNIEATGMQIEQLTEADMLGVPAIFRRTVRGVARKSS